MPGPRTDEAEAFRKWFAGRFRELRERSGISQEKLGEIVGVSQRTVGGIETGWQVPAIWRLPVYAKAMGAKVEEFFPPTKKGGRKRG